MIPNAQLHNEWWVYVLVAAGYTIFVPWLSTNPILSKRNARSISYVIGVHLAFLGIILGPTWLAIHMYPFMPNWLIEFHARLSFFGILCFGFLSLFAVMENQCIYRESNKCKPVRKKQTEMMPNKKMIPPERH
jgi:hypothetical protein